MPDLPADIDWPTRPGYPSGEVDLPTRYADLRETVTMPAPLHFLGQIDLAAVARTGALKGRFPCYGRLLLFWDAKFGPWAGGATSCRVLWDRSPAGAIAAREVPPELGKPDGTFDIPSRFAAKPVAFLPSLSMPDRVLLKELAEAAGAYELLESLDDPDWEDEWDAFFENARDLRREQLASGRAVLPHRLGGWPSLEQCGPRFYTTAAQAAPGQWALLAQIDLRALMCGFSEGVVYFVISEAGLKSGNFARVHAIYQQS
jgi:hypothetical protein